MDLLRYFADRHCGFPILVYSMFEDAAHVLRALNAGAKGYITKGEANETLAAAVRACVSGQRFLSPKIERIWRESARVREGMAALSFQERQVFELLGQGFSTAAIATLVGLSPRTVECYFARVQRKLGVRGMQELRRQAVAPGAAPIQ